MAGESGSTGGDPVRDLQRWLVRSGARGLGKQLTGQVRRAFGYGDPGDVWQTATSRPEADEPPECAWCPICRAARRIRQAGPGLGVHLSEAGDTVAAAVQEAVAAFETAVRAATRRDPASSTGRTGPTGSPGSGARLGGHETFR